MPITEILAKNAELYRDDTALVEINPQELEKRRTSWREFSLIAPTLIRLLWVLATLFVGCGIIAYIIAAVVIPRNPN